MYNPFENSQIIESYSNYGQIPFKENIFININAHSLKKKPKIQSHMYFCTGVNSDVIIMKV